MHIGAVKMISSFLSSYRLLRYEQIDIALSNDRRDVERATGAKMKTIFFRPSSQRWVTRVIDRVQYADLSPQCELRACELSHVFGAVIVSCCMLKSTSRFQTQSGVGTKLTRDFLGSFFSTLQSAVEVSGRLGAPGIFLTLRSLLAVRALPSPSLNAPLDLQAERVDMDVLLSR